MLNARLARLTPLAGGLLGAVLFLGVFGPDVIRPTDLGRLMRHDTQTYVLAWHHFRREPWQLPLGSIAGVGHPVGTSIGNADAVPLVAVPLKVLHAVLPDPVQYLGAWVFLCFILQGVFGALLVRQLTPDPLIQILGAALFVQVPALLQRTGHPALCSHWMLLAAIWLICDRQERSARWRLAAWSLLCAAAAATQPYLAVMVIGLAMASLANAALGGDRSERRLVRLAAEMATIVAVTLLVFWQCGFFMIGAANLGLGGVGVYSMNLLAPVMRVTHYSTLLPEIAPATPGQYEGMIYFGAGWLALTALAAWLWLRRGATMPRLGLGWLVVLGFTLLAVSPIVTAGSSVLVDLTAWSPSLLATFRSSGRFGWLPMYVAFVAVLTAVLAALPRQAVAATLAAAVVLQAVDLRGGYAVLYGREHDPGWTEWDNPLKSGVWNVALPHYRHLVMAPPDMCADPWPNPAGPHLPFSLAAGSHGVTINSGFAGRYDGPAIARYCAVLAADMRAARLDDDSLYVVSPAVRTALTAAAVAPIVCGTADGFDLCATASSYARWSQAAAAAGVILRP